MSNLVVHTCWHYWVTKISKRFGSAVEQLFYDKEEELWVDTDMDVWVNMSPGLILTDQEARAYFAETKPASHIWI
jgi:hypothetical protein